MMCNRCKKEIIELWERYKTYKGIEEHHNPPKFMVEKWEGTTFFLCVGCHDELHKKIIEILNKNSNFLKFCDSEYWTWIKMIGEQKKKALQEIVEFTNRWLKKDENTNTITKE